jgi:uncharacterized repeat protein (TIGR01451 family)
VFKQATPDPVAPGERLTYTMRVTNTGNVDLHAAITDTLPEHCSPTGVINWMADISAPGGVWMQTVVVTVDVGYAGPLTNVVQVSTLEGATGIDSASSQAITTPSLLVVKQAHSDTVQAGERLTYTIRVTNTGNVYLHAAITDVLPGNVSPGGSLTWTAEIAAPGGVWMETVVVTADVDYAGALTNVVQVSTLEGATGIYTETSQVEALAPALLITKQAQPSIVQAGERLTYTMYVTNTGSVDLHATISDSLPSQVSPSGTLTWAATIPAPGGVWRQTVVVTVEAGYAGPLTNTVLVNTLEGATGAYRLVSTAILEQHFYYLPLLIKRQ